MKTGIEKFKNVISADTCDLLIKHIEENIDKTEDRTYLPNQNVICKEMLLEAHSKLDNLVYQGI